MTLKQEIINEQISNSKKKERKKDKEEKERNKVSEQVRESE